jgi:hypothetical protein
MEKKEIIENIKRITNKYGFFQSGEVEQDGETYSPCINSMGGLVALAERFGSEVEVNVYDTASSDCNPIHTYDMPYEELSDDVLNDILMIARQYEAEQKLTTK